MLQLARPLRLVVEVDQAVHDVDQRILPLAQLSFHIGRVLLALLFGDLLNVFDGDKELENGVKQVDEEVLADAVDEHGFVLAE